MTYATLAVERHGSAARVLLNRPDARNAMSQQMIADLLDYFTVIRDDRSLRVVVLGGAGGTFCAGGDIREMSASVTATREEQLANIARLDDMLLAVNQAPQVVVAEVTGAALGGGVGLVCVADIALAADNAALGFPEVRLGIVPAIVSPYVVARIGLGQARRLMLTGALLNGTQAAAVGLVTQAHPADALTDAVNAVVRDALKASPSALAACKALLFEVAGRHPRDTEGYRVDLLHRLQTGDEGQEGLRAFVEKRKPAWTEDA
ncbi:MAG: enoyl-CoA hydratase-related protein [Anaerolineae bacterium]